MESPRFIICPKCQQSLPLNAVRCQFCGQPIAADVPKTVPGVKVLKGIQAKKYDFTWQEWAYIFCSGLVFVTGIALIALGAGVMSPGLAVFGAFITFIGWALYAQHSWAQFIAKCICILVLVNCFWALLWMRFTTIHFVVTVVYAFMLYIINDTMVA